MFGSRVASPVPRAFVRSFVSFEVDICGRGFNLLFRTKSSTVITPRERGLKDFQGMKTKELSIDTQQDRREFKDETVQRKITAYSIFNL